MSHVYRVPTGCIQSKFPRVRPLENTFLLVRLWYAIIAHTHTHTHTYAHSFTLANEAEERGDAAEMGLGGCGRGGGGKYHLTVRNQVK